MVHRRSGAGCQAQDLACAAHVGVSQRSVGVNQVHRCGGMDDDLDAGGELTKCLRRQTKSVARQVTGHNLHAVQHRVIPDAQVDEVLANTSDTGRR